MPMGTDDDGEAATERGFARHQLLDEGSLHERIAAPR